MIVTRLSGGLGNQMFQYAAGRALSNRLRAELRVDIRAYIGHSVHNGYELSQVFDLSPSVATESDIAKILGWRRYRYAQKFLQRLPISITSTAISARYSPEREFRYWPGFEDLADDTYLDGFWQSPLYFKDVSELILRDFTFRAPLRGKPAEYAAAIQAGLSTSLHVRRGDFVSNPKASEFHGTLPFRYYKAAMEEISVISPLTKFFVFSDDIHWAKKNLPAGYNMCYAEGNSGANSYIDMQLMSMCEHNILANSSFSWWSAWLNRSPTKIVVAPCQWFLTSTKVDTSDLCPPQWLRL